MGKNKLQNLGEIKAVKRAPSEALLYFLWKISAQNDV
jgi:hypothetical protein